MHSCGVRKKSPLHSVTAINRVLDDGYRLSHLRLSTLLLHTLRLKLHRFDLSPCLLQTCLYNIDNKSIKWSLSIIVQICGKNRWVVKVTVQRITAANVMRLKICLCKSDQGRCCSCDATMLALNEIYNSVLTCWEELSELLPACWSQNLSLQRQQRWGDIEIVLIPQNSPHNFGWTFTCSFDRLPFTGSVHGLHCLIHNSVRECINIMIITDHVN